MSGRRSSSRATTRSSSSLASARPGEIALLHDRGGETRFGENHYARGRLDEMRAGARADDEKERVLDLAVQPYDSRQAAEDLPLPALAQDRRIDATFRAIGSEDGHPAAPTPCVKSVVACAACRRAARSLKQELSGIDNVGSVGRKREKHVLARAKPSGEQGDQIGRVQRQHEHADDVFPEERRRKEITPEDVVLPDRAGDHDEVEEERLDNDRCRCGPQPVARRQVPDDEHDADEEDEELQRGEDALHKSPG